MPLAVPCSVVINGLQSRPDLNGRRGRAVEYVRETARYNVTVDGTGENIALKEANLRLNDDTGRPAPGAMPAMPAMPEFLKNVEAKQVGLLFGVVLVFGLGFSLLNAGLCVGLGLLGHSASKRHGGMLPAGRKFATWLSDKASALTGARITPAQAAFLLVACGVMLWWQMIGFSAGGSGAASGDSAGYGGHTSSHDRRRTSQKRYEHENSRGRYDAAGTRRRYESSYGSDYGSGYGSGGAGGGFLGLGSGFDLSFMLGAGMLGSMVYRLGGGGRPGGWSIGQFIHGVRNMDFFQMMMFMNLVQQVLGGGRRRRGMYF